MNGTNTSLIESLQFRSVARPTRATSKTPRAILLDFLDQQTALVNAEMDERELRVVKHRYAKDADGKPVKRRIQVKPRRAYWEADGEWLLECRYGNVPVELSPGNPTIFAGSDLQQVAATLATIRRAVERGEADEALAVAVEKARRKSA
jgi:hypothetical protein